MRNSIVSSRHNIGYKSDHSIVSLNIDQINLTRGPGYFKLYKSLNLNEDYQEIIRNSISEMAEIIKEGNPNTKWELIKGTVRNETIKYATYKNKETIKQEKTLTNEITQLQKELADSSDANIINLLKDKLDEKSNTLETITETKLNGLIMRSKANIIKFGEKIANISLV